VDVKRVGRDMGVRYVVEGSVRRGGNRVRISAQLIDATTGNHIWAERYDRELSDFFDLQDEISETIAGAIEPELNAFERERSRSSPPQNLDAWESTQRGFGHLWQFDKDEIEDAKHMFQRAIELDSDFGPAHSGLGYSHLLSATLRFSEDDAEALQEAIRCSKAATALDDRDALAHTTLGRAYVFSADLEEGISELESAIDLNPSFALAHFGLGQAFICQGRAEESVAAINKAVRLSPHDPYLWMWEMQIALAHSYAGNNTEAVTWARRSTRHPTSGYWAFFALAVALGHMNHNEEARRALDKLLYLEPRFSVAGVRQFLHIAIRSFADHCVEGVRKAGLESIEDPPAIG
jgi:tetratricopeptide (TPR) repeat protein